MPIAKFEITLRGTYHTEKKTQQEALHNFLDEFEEVSWPADCELVDWDVCEITDWEE